MRRCASWRGTDPPCVMYRARIAGLTALVLAAAAPVAYGQQTGGAEYRSAPWLAATAFEVAPATLAPGATLTVSFRIDGRPRRARGRGDLVPQAGGPPAP